MTQQTLEPGQRIRHAEFGEGVIVGAATNGFVRAFFGGGERQVPVVSLTPIFSRSEQIVRNVGSGDARNRRAWLAFQAHALPLLESAAALTSAKIDLLPHQVVLTHRIATASPRRYLIADEVGLGKTIETALLLRELASRGEMNRALMVVPAGLVNNWHRELNEVFNLDFEVFGSQGDVFDRKSNAFMKHDRLIASVDTLKLRPRVKKLNEAPMWDLVVFDEAQHLTASRSGGKPKKTENYRLAESLKDHCRDLILLSATPHQGDHYRFYMLMKLLDPTMFTSPEDMVENRHRLNSIIFRRTKADACRPDGSTLFARRWVHTESFIMSDVEREFYNELNVYLMDGFALAKQQGSKGRALGFVMTIFQKIAASSFAAVHRTLRRRLIALTVQEGLMHDSRLDIDARDAAFTEARQLIMREFHLPEDRLGQIESERLLADLKRRIVKRMDDDELAILSSEYSSETATSNSEDSAIVAVELALPEERQRIRDLLSKYPPEIETKVKNLINALGTLWQQDSSERVVIFATYLGSVEMLGEEIEKAYPGQGVVVLKGGDHGSKLAAEKRFKQQNGPRVMICTAAGREGINLQHARVLFNFDLPWNPMDLEQRIGRIHRYGQKHTAQVYNLVLSDTIEGKIFLLLDDKLKEIAKTLGKVDEHGEVAEDLRSQILGQLSERLSYESLYAQAISDPELKRTRLELEQALSNASEARNVVYELFQDLDGFSLDDYQPFSDTTEGMDEIVRFVRTAAEEEGKAFRPDGDRVFVITTPDNGEPLRFTTDRDASIESEHVDLLGLDHPTVVKYMQRFRDLPDDQIGIRVRSEDGRTGVLSIWHVATQGDRGETRTQMLSLAVEADGQRIPSWEKQADRLFQLDPASPDREPQIDLLTETLEPMIQRELVHRGFLAENRGYDARLVGWVEVTLDVERLGSSDAQASLGEPKLLRINRGATSKPLTLDVETFSSIYCLSVQQPYSEWVVAGLKRVENRSWTTDYRGTLLIHASSQTSSFDSRTLEEAAEIGYSKEALKQLPTGAIIGCVELAGVISRVREDNRVRGPGEFLKEMNKCLKPFGDELKGELLHQQSDLHYDYGIDYWWIFARPKKFEVAIPCKGSLRLWTPTADILEQVIELG